MNPRLPVSGGDLYGTLVLLLAYGEDDAKL